MAMYMQTVPYTQGDMNNHCTPWGACQENLQTPCNTPPNMSPNMMPNMSPTLTPTMPPLSPMNSYSAPMGSCEGATWDQMGTNQMCQPATEVPAMEPAAPTTVLLKGLPNGMCANSAYMEVVLDEAGLDGCYIEIKVTQGNPCGRAVIKFSSWTAAAHCIRHFSGCIWDEAGMPVSACFAKTKTSTSNGKKGLGSRQTSAMSASASDMAASPSPPSASPKMASVAYEKAPTPSKGSLASPSKAPRPTLAKQGSNEDSDGSAGSTRGSTRSAKSTSPSLSPQSRPLWADLVSDDEDEC
mmetsp:Transcript_94805/g.204640  ORF Transcript_94805/g.204640 Transcript_94805/m.204640 type:complete len:297 (+) Transcript_94805:115-1005(+)